MDLKNINNISFFQNDFIKSSYETINNPKLIEPSVKYFFKNVLHECNNIKKKNYNLYYNLGLFILFIGILGITLLIRYKGNKTKKEQNEKKIKDNEYIMSKLAFYNKMNIDNIKKQNNNMITDLPLYNNHPEASLLHRKIYF